jgi:outer membrane murein-binding lipoprotein Lpp
MPGTNRIPPLLALVAAVAALSGCGSGDDIKGQIPATNADQLNAALDAVRAAAQANPPDCEAAASQADQFVNLVNDLPESAGTDLKAALRDAGGNLQQLVNDQCPPTGATGPSGAQPASSSTPSTTDSSTTSSSTDTTETTTTSTTSSTQQTQPPGHGNGAGNGGGDGNGGGGGDGGGGDGGGGDGGGGDGGTGGGTGGTGG